MKNLYAYTLIGGLLVGGSACTKLDEELPGSFSKNFTPSNPGVGIKNNVNKPQPNDGLQGAFSKVLDGTATNGGNFAVQELGTDEAVITQKGGDWFDGGLYIAMHHHEFSPQTWEINNTWIQSYGGIFQCNTLIAGLAASDPAFANKKAQLRVLRAFFYWRLMDVFGRVPIVTTAGTGAAQSNRDVVCNFILTELWSALPDLPAGKQEYGRLSQGAANALLARVYLNHPVYLGTGPTAALYDSAINAADRVINSGIYDLDPDYAKVFAPDNVENMEHIFVAPFDEATGQNSYWAQMTLHYPSQLTFSLQQQPWNGFSTLEAFYNSYNAADKRKAANFIVGPQFDVTHTNQVLDIAFDKADPDGAGLNFTPFINELAPNGSRQGGARFGKFSFKIGQSPSSDNDFPLLRYGEVLLNKAEALFRKNGYADGTGLATINLIRARAGVPAYGGITEGELLAERGRELFVEQLRRTDLIRFGAYGNAWWENTGDPDVVTHTVMAIPLEQIQATNGTAFPLVQNPGY